MVDRTGQQLGNYRLLRPLGHGGFAEVYLSEHLELGTQAAIKILHTQVTSDDVEHFRREARTIARLVHPHIVRVFDFGVEGTLPFLVMDYAPNGTLRKLHPKGVPLPFPTIVSYVAQIADALQYAHDEHLIHRDIKPENLLLGRRNEILLSDFGITLLAQSSRSQSTQDVANDGMAYSVIAALKAQQLNRRVLVTGQDATVAGIQNILTGDQAMTVYKAITKEAQATANIVKALYNGSDTSSLTNGVTVQTSDGGNIPSILETPVAVDKTNIASTVLADGFVTKADICQGLPAGTDGIC